jgi:hypothetical protein
MPVLFEERRPMTITPMKLRVSDATLADFAQVSISALITETLRAEPQDEASITHCGMRAWLHRH